MSYFFRIGSIYSFYYTHWIKNPKIYAFILYGNPISPKVHALNLAAKELHSIDQARLIHIIAKLIKTPNTSIYSGLLLYRIFVSYAKQQLKKCYRTYFHQYITSATIVNYGLNKKEDFSQEELRLFNPHLLFQAKKDLLIRLMNIYTHRGVELASVKNTLAKIETKTPILTGLTGTKSDANTLGKPVTDIKEPGIPEKTTESVKTDVENMEEKVIDKVETTDEINNETNNSNNNNETNKEPDGGGYF